jgi:glycosyltransferase involved in cell wall biosynthesis
MASRGAISCIMPVYNGARYIEAAIESLVRQSVPPAQIIVVDDGSTDDSGALAIAAGKGLAEVIRQENRGPNLARETALPLVSGDYIYFIDADDLCPAGALEAMLDALQADPEWDAVFGTWCNFWIDELAGEEETEGAAHLRGDQQNLFLNAGLLRSAWLKRAERMTSSDLWHAPILWLAEMQRCGAHFGRINVPTLHRRIHHSNISRQKSHDDLVNLAFNLHRAARSQKKASVQDIAGNGQE